ncbi:hypothetical protein Ae706Ps2_6724c [Pseudonocardia sp. Ae706_Ps2]|nr:hypothetical protein Ae706Ps2_6724c [Pseudonocardia sp. Ae706_Ps2]
MLLLLWRGIGLRHRGQRRPSCSTSFMLAPYLWLRL